MPSTTQFLVFLSAAITLAVLPGPGLLYVLARSIHGGTRGGLHSTAGVVLGGLVHVLAATAGLSALLVRSATAFTVVRWLGAAYLVVLGVRMILGAKSRTPLDDHEVESHHGSLRQGVIVEILNPKTALFFLSFLPQFITTTAPAWPQLLLLGVVVVTLNAAVDVAVAVAAGPLSRKVQHAGFMRRQQQAGGVALVGLGVVAAFSGGKTTN